MQSLCNLTLRNIVFKVFYNLFMHSFTDWRDSTHLYFWETLPQDITFIANHVTDLMSINLISCQMFSQLNIFKMSCFFSPLLPPYQHFWDLVAGIKFNFIQFNSFYSNLKIVPIFPEFGLYLASAPQTWAPLPKQKVWSDWLWQCRLVPMNKLCRHQIRPPAKAAASFFILLAINM